MATLLVELEDLEDRTAMLEKFMVVAEVIHFLQDQHCSRFFLTSLVVSGMFEFE